MKPFGIYLLLSPLGPLHGDRYLNLGKPFSMWSPTWEPVLLTDIFVEQGDSE